MRAPEISTELAVFVGKFRKTTGNDRAFDFFMDHTKVGQVDVCMVSSECVSTEGMEIYSGFRRSGIAKLMYKSLFSQLKNQGIKTVQSANKLTSGGRAVWRSLQKDGLSIKELTSGWGTIHNFEMNLERY